MNATIGDKTVRDEGAREVEELANDQLPAKPLPAPKRGAIPSPKTTVEKAPRFDPDAPAEGGAPESGEPTTPNEKDE
jgi:hypothetical protein